MTQNSHGGGGKIHGKILYTMFQEMPIMKSNINELKMPSLISNSTIRQLNFQLVAYTLSH
jgi:hypothetical protein